MRFHDVDGATSRLTIEGWFTTVSTAAAVARLLPHFQRLAQEHLDRVAAWSPEGQ